MALEIDITSRTHPNIYRTLGVPELWRFDRQNLQINVLQAEGYVETEMSALFPNLPLKEMIPYYLEESKTIGLNAVMKAFRQWVRESMKSA